MKKTAFLRYIVLLMLPVLACSSHGLATDQAVGQPAPTATAEFSVQMIITGDLHIRVAPGAENPLITGRNVLTPGEVVTCYEFRVIGDSLWCRHGRGWSNASWMQAEY